jgi:hypothetical protein
MSKYNVTLKIYSCGSYSVLGAIAKYFNGVMPLNYHTIKYVIICATADELDVINQCNALGLTNYTLERFTIPTLVLA